MATVHNYIYEYYDQITRGEVVVGKWIRLAYKMLVDDLEKGVTQYNAKAVNKAIKFIENFCHHSKGRSDLLKLELWQKAAVAAIFGIVDDNGVRVYREVFIVIARKNGKSLLASAIIAYMAYLEPEYGQEIYCLAPKLDQAALVYDGFYKMVFILIFFWLPITLAIHLPRTFLMVLTVPTNFMQSPTTALPGSIISSGFTSLSAK